MAARFPLPPGPRARRPLAGWWGKPAATALLASLAVALAPAPAAGGGPPRGQRLVSEVRLGVLDHDLALPSARRMRFAPFSHVHERGVNLNAEVLFGAPALLRPLLAPRPRLGASINTAGDTSSAYADLVWGHAFDLGPFVEGYLGGAIHDGPLERRGPDVSAYGSRLLFHLGLELGWRFDRLGISLMWEHLSNGNLARPNHGLDSLGLRASWRFDG